MKNLLLPAFIIVALVQWYVPGKMILDSEKVLREGKTFRFLTEPVDPSNPFIGKYITLNFKEESFSVDKADDLVSANELFVLLTTDANGFARIKDVVAKEPSGNIDYVKAKLQYTTYEGNRRQLHIDYPFDKYYMDEFKAPKAEDVYRKATADTAKQTYAVVKVWKGRAVTENVIIDNTPIRELIK